jgi:hypothetical protein
VYTTAHGVCGLFETMTKNADAKATTAMTPTMIDGVRLGFADM